MAPTKDYYKALGVPETASADEIKKAYRKLAKRYHPDATGGDKAKEVKFKEVTEAYETVGDDKKRKEYDTARKNPFTSARGFDGGGFAGGPRGGRRASRVDVSDLNDLFGGAGQRGGAGGGGGFYDVFADMFKGGGAPGDGRARVAEKGEDARARVEIDLPLAAVGGELPLTVDGRRLTVKVPAGIEDGQTIRIAGHGQPGPAGPGDLLIDVKVRPHAQFRRHGDDLEVDVPVAVDLAILGAKVEVPTLEGPAKVTVPPSTSSGLKLRLKGKGARKRASAERGDLYAVIQLTVPKDLSDKARELIEEFGRLTRKAP